ncbi:MAG: 4-hydroxy-tetrahydrodipicolinate synthase [Candidatus Omnitrophota bacterium]|jgi:4-hydroxy-tetrahydrodipicolinate synthase|nr:4-hydroxy-tetrahydrodipicolinate synthase [Candidatus Omnitrophota bacterium]MDD3982913.1 4-hydroxy-tetrahydrodipicolinate synthase [Candidatus Omnitrophota bacterium]MDD5525922.1 4-hydroxy-tetrahydrodipicolinate synthase [Candidatus Omnitrophota bacterium]
MFSGSIVALVTPFKNGKVDEKRLRSLIDFQIENGTSGIVPCGTTGESATLSVREHERVIEISVEQSAGRVPVIAGTGSNSTQEAIQLTVNAAKSGAGASLQISPYYNRPTQKGLYEHFKAVADAAGIPVILYNIASRTGVNIEPETIARLAADCKNIVGVKEASGSLDQMSRVKALCGEKFDLISGDDSLTLPVLAIGGTGVISVAANIVPADVAALIDNYCGGKAAEARRLHYRLLPLIKSLFLETNPIPVKTAMGMLGMCDADVRLPLTPMSEDNAGRLRASLKDYGLLKE